MADEQLRALERRFRQTGTTEDEAAWLDERVRAGVLPAERVGLAGALGHPAAAASRPVEEGFDRVAAVEALGPEAVVRALVAVALSARPKWARSKLRGKKRSANQQVREKLEAAQDWLVDPSPAAAARAAAAAAAPVDRREDVQGFGGWAAQQAAHVAGGGGLRYVPPEPSPDGPRVGSMVRIEAAYQEALEAHAGGPRSILADAVGRLGPPPPRQVWPAVGEELVPWLLGYRDPVADRVRARRGR